MKYAVFTAVLLTSACATAPTEAQSSACLPAAGFDRAELEAVKTTGWHLPNDAARNRLALALAACVADPDPAVRDGIAFEAYTHWLRGKQLTQTTMRTLVRDLSMQMRAPDEVGLRQPFAALVLSELARADRIEPYLNDHDFGSLVSDAQGYFIHIRDYRGFDEREGWRHSVAHGADLLLQLGINPRLGSGEQYRLVWFLQQQIAPADHFYIYGEPERLARPIIFIAQRGDLTEQQWTEYFASLLPREGENLFASQAGLARRHNVNAFLSTVYMNARLSESTADDVLLPGVEAAIRAMP